MSKINKAHVQEELDSILESNTLIKSAANMVGYNVEAETLKLLESADQRVRVNIHQKGRIETLKSLLEDEAEQS